MKILIAEDEIVLQQSIAEYLIKSGNICETASDYNEGAYKISLYDYDVILLDINLITGSGLDLLKLLKNENKEAAVIIISANNSLDDKILGLDLGADDYLTKPFHLAELNSRINAVLRRGKFQGKNTIVFNEIIINTKSSSVTFNEKEIHLTKKEYDLLIFFITNKGRVLSKDTIAEHLWGEHSNFVDSYHFIYVHVKNLRQKLTKVGAKYIKTVYGFGYKFVENED